MYYGKPSPEGGLTIRLFGGMAIEDSRGVSLLPRSRKTRAIVAILALTAPMPMPRSRFTALLWSQREIEQSRASLRQAVHELRSSLGPRWDRVLVAERHALTMDMRGVVVDGLAAIEPTAPKTELLKLFQDGFLDELRGLDPAFDVWLAQEKRRLAEVARQGGEAFLLETHAGPEVIEIARAVLRIDPKHVGAWQALIGAFIAASDRAAARLACEQWREAIGLERDDPPPPEMAALLSLIRVGAAQSLSRPKPGRIQPDNPGEPDEQPSSKHRRPVPRIGIREMRLIGPNVDPALPVGLAE
jgi:DNA-binding SARP family transcriptional activator